MKFTEKTIKEGLRDLRSAVSMDENACKDMRAFLLSKVSEDKMSGIIFKDKVRAVRDWMGLNWVSVRVATVGMIVLSVLGGSITTVSASLASLPGDFLFPVKRTTEKIQVALQTSETGKAKLKVEFASRRLAEAKTIIESENPEKEAKVALAIENFKIQIENIKEDLTNAEPQIMAETAKMVVEKTNEYRVVISQAIQDMPAVKDGAEMAGNTVAELGTEAGKIVIANTEVKEEVTNTKVAVTEENSAVTTETRGGKPVIAPVAVVPAEVENPEVFKIELQMIEEEDPDEIKF